MWFNKFLIAILAPVSLLSIQMMLGAFDLAQLELGVFKFILPILGILLPITSFALLIRTIRFVLTHTVSDED